MCCWAICDCWLMNMRLNITKRWWSYWSTWQVSCTNRYIIIKSVLEYYYWLWNVSKLKLIPSSLIVSFIQTKDVNKLRGSKSNKQWKYSSTLKEHQVFIEVQYLCKCTLMLSQWFILYQSVSQTWSTGTNEGNWPQFSDLKTRRGYCQINT